VTRYPWFAAQFVLPYLRCTSLSQDKYEAELKCEYDYDKVFKKRWRVSINSDGLIELPEELLGRLGWRHNDVLEWFDFGADEFLLVKIDKQ